MIAVESDALTDWSSRLEELSQDRGWFDDQFMKFTAFFLKRDIICHTSNVDLKYCGRPLQLEGDIREDFFCECVGVALHIANINNAHYQSLLPLQMHSCNECNYTTPKEANLKRHYQSKHEKRDQIPKSGITTENANSTEKNDSAAKAGSENSQIKKYTCVLCGQWFHQPQYLNRHINVDHNPSSSCNENSPSKAEIKKFQCNSCKSHTKIKKL